MALVAAIVGKLIDSLFGKGGSDSEDLKRALEQLIQEIAGLITGAINRALDDYHATEAFDRLLAVGDMARPYDLTHDLPTLEAAFTELYYRIRRLKSLDPEVGYGPFCMAASLQLGIAQEMLHRKSGAMTKALLLSLVDEHEAYAKTQEAAILKSTKEIKVGAIGSESVFTHPATDPNDPQAPEKRDVKSFEWSMPTGARKTAGAL